MLRVIKQNITALRHPIYASLTLAFASLGDAFLYPFLPQNAEAMQIPVVWIGVLLSINRFIRIIFNSFVIKLFAKQGVRQTTIAAACIAILSTFGYGLGWGLVSLLVFRILWGMSFAIIRISTLAYVFEQERVGFSLGASRCIQEAGPMLSLFAGPILLSHFSGEMTFSLLAILSVPALFYAFRLPELNYQATSKKPVNFSLPSLFNATTFLLSFIVEGILIVVLGVLLARNNVHLSNWMIPSLAAAYLAYRRTCFILFAPISGALADRIGCRTIFRGSLLMIVAGLIFLLVGRDMIGLVIIFTFNSVNSAMAPGGATDNEPDKLKAVTSNATWRDIGAAIGTLSGGLLLSGSFLLTAILIATFMLIVLLMLHFRKSKL